jgi:hypothetical protein
VSISAEQYGEYLGVMKDVRPWSEAEVTPWRARVLRALRESWTASFELDGWPVEVAHTPRQVRVRLLLGDGDQWLSELHVLPQAPPNAPADALPLVVCNRRQNGPECIGVRRDWRTTSREHPSLGADVALAAEFAWRGVPRLLRRPSRPDKVYLTRLDSPAGPLDCVFVPPTGVTDLEGALLVGGRDVALGYHATCVDTRGLLLLETGGSAEWRPLTKAEPTVDDDVTTYPAEVTSYAS